MSTLSAADVVLDVLRSIAPDAADVPLDPTASLREQLDLDSMDFLAFVVGLDDKVGVSVPEEDYPRLTTMAGAVDYVATHLAAH